jgi:hypothetical protein
MNGQLINLYPTTLIDADRGTARVSIATPPKLPWQQLWMPVGVTLYALSGAYSTAKDLLGDPNNPHCTDVVSSDDDLRIARLSYNSPLDIELIVGFATAFSLVWAVSSGAVTTTIKLLEWIEKKKEFQGEHRLRDLEIKLKNLELESKQAQITQTASTRQPQASSIDQVDPQLVIIEQLLFFGGILAGEHSEIWTPFSSEHREWSYQPYLQNDKAEIRYGAFGRDTDGHIWFYPASAPHIIGGTL